MNSGSPGIGHYLAVPATDNPRVRNFIQPHLGNRPLGIQQFVPPRLETRLQPEPQPGGAQRRDGPGICHRALLPPPMNAIQAQLGYRPPRNSTVGPTGLDTRLAAELQLGGEQRRNGRESRHDLSTATAAAAGAANQPVINAAQAQLDRLRVRKPVENNSATEAGNLPDGLHEEPSPFPQPLPQRARGSRWWQHRC